MKWVKNKLRKLRDERSLDQKGEEGGIKKKFFLQKIVKRLFFKGGCILVWVKVTKKLILSNWKNFRVSKR